MKNQINLPIKLLVKLPNLQPKSGKTIKIKKPANELVHEILTRTVENSLSRLGSSDDINKFRSSPVIRNINKKILQIEDEVNRRTQISASLENFIFIFQMKQMGNVIYFIL